MATKAIRFSEKEEKMINSFLQENPYFDFSTLGRMAILSFVQNPKIEFKAIKRPKNSATTNKTSRTTRKNL